MTQNLSRYTAPLAALLLIFVSVSAPADAAPRTGKAISFLTGPQQGDPYTIAMDYVQSQRQALGLTDADLQDVVVRDRFVTQHNGVTHLHFQQRLGGIEVYNGLLSVNVAADGSIINLRNLFVGDLAGKANTDSPTLSDRAAILRAAEHYGLTPSENGPSLVRAGSGADLRAAFADEALSRDEIPARLVYQPLEDGRVRLAWDTLLNLVDSPNWWQTRVDAVTGEVISELNLTNYDSYRVIPFPPFSDPDDSGGQADVIDPADLTASPFGWHDNDNMAGADFTDTQGNNVDAHDDLDGNNAGGTRPDGGAGLDFLFDFDPAEPPTGGTNLEAAIVNLFYANNVMHDILFHYGFDEPAGNFEFVHHQGMGGAPGDHVEADALDNANGSPPSCSNANFSTPADGFSPRMQMFKWPALFNGILDAPGAAGSPFDCGKGCWGGELDPPTVATIQEVNDGSANPTHGCVTPFIGFTSGNIALIDRGSCEFGTKALNAQMEGASAAIIVNDLQQGANGIISMGAGADGGSVTILAVMVGNADGNAVRAALPLTGTLSQNPTGIDRDSDFDNGIIAHEYGHGISIRLTGGPSSVGCLSGSEQAGEGWSDFWTMVLTAKPGDTPELPKGVGNYVIFEPVNGPGIRDFPYTTDMTVNPHTYATLVNDGDLSVPHGVGSVWMAMVWEMYWELVDKHGFDTDFYTGSGGNNLTIQLVIDGLKLQGCLPTFTIARDAILMADLVNNGGANECEIWRAFAKRGLGVSADDGGSTSIGNETEAFDIPGHCPVGDFIFADGFETGDSTGWPNLNP